MKKKFVLAAAILFSVLTNNLFAQTQTDVKGMNVLNAGIGLGSYGLVGTGGLPLTVSFEHGFSKYISGGIEAGFVQRKFTDSWKYSYLMFGARASYHFNDLLKIGNPKMDIYGGAGLLYRHYKVKYANDELDEFYGKSSAGAIDLQLHAGGRYMFSSNVGGFAEVGYGISPLKLGATFKF